MKYGRKFDICQVKVQLLNAKFGAQGKVQSLILICLYSILVGLLSKEYFEGRESPTKVKIQLKIWNAEAKVRSLYAKVAPQEKIQSLILIYLHLSWLDSSPKNILRPGNPQTSWECGRKFDTQQAKVRFLYAKFGPQGKIQSLILICLHSILVEQLTKECFEARESLNKLKIPPKIWNATSQNPIFRH